MSNSLKLRSLHQGERALWDPSSDSKAISVVFLPQTNMCLVAAVSSVPSNLGLSNPSKSNLRSTTYTKPRFAAYVVTKSRKSTETISSRNLETEPATCPSARMGNSYNLFKLLRSLLYLKFPAFRGRPHAEPRAARQRCRSQWRPRKCRGLDN